SRGRASQSRRHHLSQRRFLRTKKMIDPGRSMSSEIGSDPPRPIRAEFFAGGLVVAGLLAYANSLSVPFVLDDTVSIIENESIRRIWPIGSVLNPPATAG